MKCAPPSSLVCGFIYFILRFFDLRKKKKCLFVRFKKQRYVMWALLPAPDEKYWEYKGIFV